MIRVTGFGQTGPYARGPATARSAKRWAACATCSASRRPPPGPGSPSATRSPRATPHRTLAALHERERSGRGQVVDSAIYEAVLAHDGERSSPSGRWPATSANGPARSCRTSRRPTSTRPPTAQPCIAANQDTVFRGSPRRWGSPLARTRATPRTARGARTRPELDDHSAAGPPARRRQLLAPPRAGRRPCGAHLPRADMLRDPHMPARLAGPRRTTLGSARRHAERRPAGCPAPPADPLDRSRLASTPRRAHDVLGLSEAEIAGLPAGGPSELPIPEPGGDHDYRLGVDVGGTFTDLCSSTRTPARRTAPRRRPPRPTSRSGCSPASTRSARWPGRARADRPRHARHDRGHERGPGGQGRQGRAGRDPRLPAGAAGGAVVRAGRAGGVDHLAEAGAAGRPGEHGRGGGAGRRPGRRGDPAGRGRPAAEAGVPAGAGVDAVTVALVNSFANAAHEQRVAELVAREIPGCRSR